MIRAFVEYERAHPYVAGSPHNVIGTPLGTRLQRIIRLRDGWRLWIATADFVYGTFMDLHNNGLVTSTTTRVGEGDESFVVRPADSEG